MNGMASLFEIWKVELEFRGGLEFGPGVRGPAPSSTDVQIIFSKIKFVFHSAFKIQNTGRVDNIIHPGVLPSLHEPLYCSNRQRGLSSLPKLQNVLERSRVNVTSDPRGSQSGGELSREG